MAIKCCEYEINIERKQGWTFTNLRPSVPSARIAYDAMIYKTSGENCQLTEDSIFQNQNWPIRRTRCGDGKWRKKEERERERCGRMVRELSVGNEIYKWTNWTSVGAQPKCNFHPTAVVRSCIAATTAANQFSPFSLLSSFIWVFFHTASPFSRYVYWIDCIRVDK